jgi:hypothetical protein
MNSPTTKEVNYNLKWNEETENIIRQWGELAEIYSYLHEQSHIKNNKRNLRFQIPSIIIATLSGFISMSLSSFSISQTDKNYINVGIGALNIFTGIISTILSILKYSELSQKHLTSSVAFKKLHIEIKTELGLERLTRKPISSFLKLTKQQFETLVETSPIIDKQIKNKFNNKAKIDLKYLPSELTLNFHPIYVSVDDDKIFEIVDRDSKSSNI